MYCNERVTAEITKYSDVSVDLSVRMQSGPFVALLVPDHRCAVYDSCRRHLQSHRFLQFRCVAVLRFDLHLASHTAIHYEGSYQTL